MDKKNSRVKKTDQETYKSIKDTLIMKLIDTNVGPEILGFLKMIIFKNQLFILKILHAYVCTRIKI